jgi:nucleoside-diphosphate-sugar epimerase
VLDGRDDPGKRRPDISVAKRELEWQPHVPVREGLTKTVDYFRKELRETGAYAHVKQR